MTPSVSHEVQRQQIFIHNIPTHFGIEIINIISHYIYQDFVVQPEQLKMTKISNMFLTLPAQTLLQQSWAE